MECKGVLYIDRLFTNIINLINTPLVTLCSSPFVSVQLLDLFLSHGADIKYISQNLDYICENEYITCDLLTYLCDRGLDLKINGEFIVKKLSQGMVPNDELISFFSKHGV